MSPRHAPQSTALRQAIILLDRPDVGRDGHRQQERLPTVVHLRATVVGASAVSCTIDADVVSRLTGIVEPTWADLEAAWQTLATRIDRKIRRGDVGAEREGGLTVHIGREDVPMPGAQRDAKRV